MKPVVVRRPDCRLCGSRKLERVVELEPIPLSEAYAEDADTARTAARYPVDIYMCAACGHVQQLDVVDPAVLWDSYSYFSGDAKGIPEHFAAMADKILARSGAPKGSLVVDIGSNDGSFLLPFKRAGHRVLGIDPAVGAVERATAAGIPTLPALMSRALAGRIRAEHGPASIVCAFNVFAHADDLGEMADCVATMLAPDGLFFFEAQYLLDILDGMLVATIFHEHVSHHSLTALAPFLERHGLELIAVERAPIQHGSLIGTVQRRGGDRPVDASVGEMLAFEAERGLASLDTMRAFDARVWALRARTEGLVAGWKASGASVAGFGAARSGPTLIAQLGIEGAIDYIVDDHPKKVGKYQAGDGIPILPTSALLQRMPDYTVILAWVHADKIIANNRAYLERGGQFVVLCPETRVVGRDGDVAV